MRQGRYDQAFPSIWLVVFVVVLGTKALAFSIQEGWQLVARAESGDQTALQTLIQAYQAQDPEAAAALGVLYLDGVVYPRDVAQAKEYFEWS